MSCCQTAETAIIPHHCFNKGRNKKSEELLQILFGSGGKPLICFLYLILSLYFKPFTGQEGGSCFSPSEELESVWKDQTRLKHQTDRRAVPDCSTCDNRPGCGDPYEDNCHEAAPSTDWNQHYSNNRIPDSLNNQI